MDLDISFSVLVVEFQDLLRNRFMEELSSTGFRVVGEKNPNTVEHDAEKAKPDLFVIGLDMPRMDGTLLIRKLRKNDLLHRVPILALSDRVDRNRVSQLMILDVKDLLKIPLPDGQLLKAAEKFYKIKVIAEIARE